MQTALPAVLVRGGTSKGLFFRGGVLPDDPARRDRILLRALGSPDPFRRQVDGLGGATSSTSKAVIVSPSSSLDADVDYRFAQVSVDRPVVDWSGTCGNLSAAAGLFAIEEGLVSAEADGDAAVRIRQVNTGTRIIARIPVRDGRPLVEGPDVIDGVPGAGAGIRVEFLEPGGSACGRLLPTSRAVDRLEIPGRGWMDVTLLDAGTPAVYVRASDMGLDGTELPVTIDEMPSCSSTWKRSAAARLWRWASPWTRKRRRPAGRGRRRSS